MINRVRELVSYHFILQLFLHSFFSNASDTLNFANLCTPVWLLAKITRFYAQIIAGDPGLGKSQLLQASASVAPRGIYVCGNTTTTAGLTVAVVRDTLSGDWVFEAGEVLP